MAAGGGWYTRSIGVLNVDVVEKLLILSCRLTGCVMTELRRAAAAAKEGLEANAGDADPSDVGSWASTPGNVGTC